MCYNVVSATRSQLKYARHRSDDQETIDRIVKYLQELHHSKILQPNYRVSGFAHPNLLVFSNPEPYKPEGFRWGLIPAWVKDWETAKKLANQTINAKSETMFEKPSFRKAARHQRCLIYLDAFYEHYYAHGRTYPFHISMQDDSPVVVAGLWDEWLDKSTGELIRTVSIVTCKANQILGQIHNNPKAEEPRMPVIIKRHDQDLWLEGTEADVKHLCKPLEDQLIRFHSVKPILGKQASENTEEAEAEFVYPDLSFSPAS